jgi:sterol desaturase/sphingolipid hydroxylase (fatty acid hydroxylase superfamily)
METTAYYAFGVPIYVAIVILEALGARRKNRETLSFAPSFGNVTAGLGSIVVGLFLGPALLLLYSFALRHFALFHWEKDSIVTWGLALVLADFGHYWHHRLDHRVAACWAVHGVHHMPEEMNFTVAMRHAWFSDLYSFPFYAPLPLLGVPTEQFFIATTLLSFHALITHSAEYDFPSLGFLVTPSSHVLHHARNAPYIDKNFGAMLCIWDRLFGTHVKLDPARPAEYGTTRGYATHAGTRAQWVLWADLIALVRRARTFREQLRVLFGRPGTTPEDVTLSAVTPPPSPAAIALGTKLYVGAQLALTVAFSLWVFVLREHHSWPVTTVSAIAITWAMASLGAVLDGRKRAWTGEKVRLAIAGAALCVTAIASA